MGKAKRNRAEREAIQIAHDHTQREEGRWHGEVGGDHPVARELIRRYNAETGARRACPHLNRDWDQARFWVEAVPELLACRECTPVLAAEEKKRANSRCLMCGRHVALRGVSVAAAGVLMRGGVCKDCEASAGTEV